MKKIYKLKKKKVNKKERKEYYVLELQRNFYG